jgi:hypothetical protein|tara:strand:+ start:579 stop:797 length:219 start_codon:yes stop_codon:yes gene_type:complete
MNIADIAGIVASGVPVKMEVELSDKLDEKIDIIRAEVKEISDKAVEKIDYRWKVTQILIGIGLLGNLLAVLL